MTKKILCVLLSVIMIFSCITVGAVAAQSTYPEYGYDDEYYDPYYDDMDYYFEIIDFLTNYMLSEDGNRPGTLGMGDPSYIDNPEIAEQHLQFMKDEIIDEYYSIKNSNGTNEDWYGLYKKLCHTWKVDPNTGEVLYYYYPYYCENSKAVVGLRYTTDKDYVMPGDDITVTLEFKSNFYSYFYSLGLMYDKQLLDIKSTTPVNLIWPTWTNTGMETLNYGYLIGQTSPNVYAWPVGMRTDECYNRWGIITDAQRSTPSAEDYQGNKSKKVDDWTLFKTYTFTVKADAPEGSELKFWIPDDGSTCNRLVDLYDMDTHGLRRSITGFSICSGPNSFFKYFETNDFDITHEVYPATATVGQAPVEPEGADYTALDAAINAFDADEAGLYKAAGWTAYANAVAAGQQVDRNLTADDQATVDAATTAITEARAALQLKSVINAVASEAVIGSDSTVTIKVDEGATNIRLAGQSGTLTFARDEAVITAGTNGTENWTVKVLTDSDRADYMVYAKFGGAYTENGVALTVIGTQGADTSILGLSVAGMYPAGTTNGGTLIKGKHQVVVKTSTDVSKVQFVAENKTTCTYDMKTAQYSDEDGVRTWVLSFNFSRFGDCVYTIRTRTPSTTFADTGSTMTATVVY